jgi:hypothetical protein
MTKARSGVVHKHLCFWRAYGVRMETVNWKVCLAKLWRWGVKGGGVVDSLCDFEVEDEI